MVLAAGLVLLGQLVMPVNAAYAIQNKDSDVQNGNGQVVAAADTKITVCHRTNATTNGYVQESIALAAAYNRYKNDVNGSLAIYPAAGWGDIVPTFTYNGETISVNWLNADGTVNADAQLVVDNDCNVAGLLDIAATFTLNKAPCVVGTTSTDSVIITVTNTNDLNNKTVTYTVSVDGQSQQVTLADGATSADITFSGLAAGTYTVTVVAGAGGDGTNAQGSVTVDGCQKPTEVALPAVLPTDPCGADNAYWTKPADTKEYTFSLENGVLTVTANAGYVFAKIGASHSYGVATDSGAACPTVTPCGAISGPTLVSADNQFADYQDTRSKGHYEFTASGLRIYTDDNSSLAKVAWYHTVDYSLASIGQPTMEYTATSGIKPGMQIALDKDGNGTLDGILVGEPDAYGNNWWSNANFGIASGMGYTSYGTLNDYLAANPSARVMAVGFSLGSGVLADGVLASLTFGCHKWVFQNRLPAPCSVTSQTYTDKWGEGSMYPEVGAYPSATAGSYVFKADGLYLSTPAVESYADGLMDAGATNLSDIDAMSYKTLRLATSTGADYFAPSYILYVDLDGDEATTDDQTYLFYEPVYNGAVQTGVWQTWDVLAGGNSTWWSFELSGGDPTLTWSDIVATYPNAVALAYGFNQGTYNQGTDSAVQDIQFDCATTHFTIVPGKGGSGGETPVSPVTPAIPSVPTKQSAAQLPAELPHTGPTNLTGIYGLLLALLTYGVVYFAQPRRGLSDER